MDSNHHPVGLTQSTGYEIGLRKTLPISLEGAWQRITSPQGLALWLGPGVDLTLAKGETCRLADGTRVDVRVFTPFSHLRFGWQPPGWERPSVIQVRVIPRGDEKTVIAFHQEHLPGPQEWEARRAHFRGRAFGIGKHAAGLKRFWFC